MNRRCPRALASGVRKRPTSMRHTRLRRPKSCEQEGADWLPFQPFGHVKPGAGAHRPDRNAEVIWTRGGLSLLGGVE